MSGKCWECGSEDHIRPNCPDWLRIIDSNGKAPAGHKGAKDKALQAWKDKKSKEKAHMKALGYETEDPNTEDEDDGSDDEQCFALGPPLTPAPVQTTNSFDQLGNDDDSDDDSVVDGASAAELLNAVASRIQREK